MSSWFHDVIYVQALQPLDCGFIKSCEIRVNIWIGGNSDELGALQFEI